MTKLTRKFHWVAIVIGFLLATASGEAWAQAKPVNQDDIIQLVNLGIDEAVIIGRIEKAGTSFTLDESAIERLKTAGVSDAVIEALKKAVPTAAAPRGLPPIGFQDVIKLLELGLDEAAILNRLEKSPTVFVLDQDQVAKLKQAGASDKLIAALQQSRPATKQAAELITQIALILDCSGSMREKTKDNETKMAAAQRVVAELVKRIPDGVEVAFVVYGHEAFGNNDPRNCMAVKVARPLSPLDAAGKTELSAMIAKLRPTGATPIALSLKTAGTELAKRDGYCGLVLITDGKETCEGDPTAEAAQLVQNLKITFGVNVVGFDVGEDRAGLEAIAAAGKGRYYNADSTAELATALGTIANELEVVATAPKKAVSNRRAIKVLKPAVDFPEYAEIRVITHGLGSISIVATGKYGDEIRLPSGTEQYEIQWLPKNGEPVAIVKEFTLSERKVVELRPEDYLGLIKVNGEGAPKKEIVVYQRGLGSIIVLQRATKFGEVMVVPATKVNIRVDDDELEEGLMVEAGTLHELE